MPQGQDRTTTDVLGRFAALLLTTAVGLAEQISGAGGDPFDGRDVLGMPMVSGGCLAFGLPFQQCGWTHLAPSLGNDPYSGFRAETMSVTGSSHGAAGGFAGSP